MWRAVVPGRRTLALLPLLCCAGPGAVQAQGFLDKLSRAAVGVRAALVDASLNRVPSTDLEGRGLPTVLVGGVAFGVSAVEAADTVGVRLHVYLHNAGAADISLPLPPADAIVLVDGKGRRLEAIGGARWKDLPRGATTIAVPGLERVTATLLYGPPGADAGLGTLKVGGAGMIAGIPLTGAAGAGSPQGGAAGGWEAAEGTALPAGDPLPFVWRNADGLMGQSTFAPAR